MWRLADDCPRSKATCPREPYVVSHLLLLRLQASSPSARGTSVLAGRCLRNSRTTRTRVPRLRLYHGVCHMDLPSLSQ